MNCGASKSDFLTVSVRLALACMISTLATSTHGQPLLLKTETFDADPGWDGTNNRATDPGPRQIVQNFGFSAFSTNAGGSAGEIGGFITPVRGFTFTPRTALTRKACGLVAIVAHPRHPTFIPTVSRVTGRGLPS